MKVEVVTYNNNWPLLFAREAKRIIDILDIELVAIYHIGSTAVENLNAKPIIDIMPVVKDIAKIDRYNQEFIALGYEPKGEFGIIGRRYFRKGQKIRTHHIHIFENSNTSDIERHLAVRDYLSAHPTDALAYGQLKSELAILYPDDIEAYCEGKDEFVKTLEKKAIVWYRKERSCSHSLVGEKWG